MFNLLNILIFCANAQVNLSEMADFSLFPGQVVAAEGTNTTGTKFTPTSLYLGAPMPLPRSDTATLVDHYFSDDGDAEVVEILVAAGPFTTTVSASGALR
jgi:DNA polymerase alpha subunit B